MRKIRVLNKVTFQPILVILGILSPGILIVLSSPFLLISVHGAFHAGYIYQIMQGTIPPTNPVLPGTPANYYWLYHSLVALISCVFNLAPPIAAFLINIVSLVISLVFTGKCIILLGLRPKKYWLFGLFILFVLVGSNLFGFFHLILNTTQKDLRNSIMQLPDPNFLVLAGDERLLSLWAKFLNFSSFPMGVAFFSFVLFISIRIIKSKPTLKDVFLLAMAIIGAMAFHATTGLFILLTVIPTIGIVWLIQSFAHRRRLAFWKDLLKEFSLQKISLLAIIIVPLAFAMGLHVYSLSHALPGSVRLNLLNWQNLASIISTLYPVLIFSAISSILVWKRQEVEFQFLALLSFLGLVSSYIFVLQDGNQYKFIFLTSLPISLLSLKLIVEMLRNHNIRLRQLSRFIGFLYLSLVIINILTVDLIYYKYERVFGNTYSFDGQQINSTRSQLFLWLRENTPVGSIIVDQPIFKNDNEFFLISQRLNYVTYGDIYNEGLPEYKDRLEELKRLYTTTSQLEKTAILKNIQKKFPDRNIYFLSDSSLPDMDILETVGFVEDTYIYLVK